MKYIKETNLEIVSIGDEIGVLNVNKGMYYVLDKISSNIWKYLDELSDVNGIVEQLMLNYEVDYEKCYSDTKELLKSLLEKELIKEV